MSIKTGDIAFVTDLFSALDSITTRPMMGGASIYSNGRIFAMLDRHGVLYLKASGAFADRMQAAGARQFSSVNKAGKSHKMGYWTLPEAALDDPEIATEWALNALKNIN